MNTKEESSNLALIGEALARGSFHRLVRAVDSFEKERFDLPHKAEVYVLKNHTLDNLQWFLKGLGYLEQIDICCRQGNYNTIMQEILDPSSLFRQGNYEVVVLSLVLENLAADYEKGEFSVEKVTAGVERMVESLMAASSSAIVCNTFLMPSYNSEGMFSYKNADSIENKIYEVNSWMRRLCRNKKRVYLVDWNQLEQRIGTACSRDYRLWYTAKSLLTNRFLKEYASEVVKLVKLLKGRPKKCLILDCDNTLWGGIVGEGGLGRIKLDPHDYPGNTFYYFQQSVLNLAERGILIALCSKNNEEDVWEVLDNHPYCLLKRSHLAAWRINWENKADNINSLAEELNLGKDSFVFVDDSGLECELVKSAIPEITVLQAPKDLSSLPSLFAKQGLFDTLSISQEDRQRTAIYQAEAMRKAEYRKYENFEEFLKSLDLIVTVNTVESHEIPRIAQLTQRTNQFNLTTRRYSEEDISSLAQNKDYDVMFLHSKDRFGDLGIIGVGILKYEEDSAVFDTFLISCRALGRKVENIFLNCCLKVIQAKGKWSARGYYLLTSKNNIAKDFYEQNGFAVTEQDKTKRVFTYDMRKFKWACPSFLKKLITNIDAISEEMKYG